MAYTGKRVLVTGGGRGLGLEIAKVFHEAGAAIVVVDKEENLLTSVKASYPSWTTVKADLLDWEGTVKALASVEACHHVVNNAGVNFRQDFLDITPDKLDLIFGVNFKATVNVSQIMAKKMIENKIEGTIVNIASYAGKIPLPSISMYSGSKGAVIMVTKSMSMELGPHNIRVNCICPTYMITDFTREYINKETERFEKILGKQVMKKFLDPVDAAKAVLYLSSPEAAMINGASLDIDGGCFV